MKKFERYVQLFCTLIFPNERVVWHVAYVWENTAVCASSRRCSWTINNLYKEWKRSSCNCIWNRPSRFAYCKLSASNIMPLYVRLALSMFRLRGSPRLVNVDREDQVFFSSLDIRISIAGSGTFSTHSQAEPFGRVWPTFLRVRRRDGR